MIENTVKISLGNIAKTSRHIHGGMECLLVIKGNLEVEVDGVVSHLKQDDMIVINDNQVHSMEGSDDNIILSLKVGRDYLESECGGLIKCSITCNSSIAEEAEKKKYFELKRLLTRLLIIYSEKRSGYRMEFKAIFYLFMNHLLQHFQIEKHDLIIMPNRTKDKNIEVILKYISDNYDKTLNLESMAERFHMSTQYFSKYFKRKVQVGFLEYVTKVRMEYAVKDLLYTDDSILRIAMNNGFANVKSFTNAFKKEYLDTPSNYRLQHKADPIEQELEDKNNQFDIELEDGVVEFLKYMYQHNSDELQQGEEIISYQTDVSKPLGSFEKPLKLINVEAMNTLLKSEVYQQLRSAQAGLKFDYVYFLIFNQPEEFYFKRGDMYDYFDLFKVIKIISEVDLAPMIRLDFSAIKANMPWESITEFYLYFKQIWRVLNHKYSGAYIRRWKVELQYSKVEDRREFFAFYHQIYMLLQPDLGRQGIGVLTLRNNQEQRKNELLTFLNETGHYRIEPGFISFYAYPEDDLTNLFSYNFKDIGEYYRQLVDEIKEICNTAAVNDIEIYMPKWNTLVGKSMAEIGTFFRSALILDTILRTEKLVKGIGFHLNTYEPTAPGDKVDTSILALYLYYTIKRPLYFVIEAVDRLGRELLFKKDGVIVTKTDDGDFVIIMYHPCYVSPVYAVDPVYISESSHQIELVLEGLEKGDYQIKTLLFDKERTDIFSCWENAGYPDFMDRDIVNYLERAVIPEITLVKKKVKNRYHLRANLTFNGVALFEIRKE